eukprot:PITA_36637
MEEDSVELALMCTVLSRKENYPEWSRKIKHTLIFNELWKGVCVGDRDKELEEPTLDKKFSIWENKNRKAYALIAASVNEEVSRHISPFSNAFEALQKLKELYDSHYALEVVQLMIKLFNLELKNYDHLALALEVKSIMHGIKVTNVELDIPLIAFLKALYPTYPNYLESLQANENLKGITFDSLVKKIVEREKDFEKKTTPQYFEEVVCLAHREKNLAQDSSIGRDCKRDGSHDASTCKLPWDRIEQERNQPKGKINVKEKGKAPESTHYVVAHSNIGVNEDLFNASLASWKNDWLLDLGATCHMNFKRGFFEEFTDNVDGAVYFADKSKCKPSGLNTIRLKLPGLPDFLLHHVLYLPQLRRNVLSLVHIHQQGHSIHKFDGNVEVRKASDHSLVMIWIEEERLLKLQGTSAHARNFSYNSHYDEGTFLPSLLWHARFGHLNYDSLRLLKKNGVSSLPTIPGKLKQCDACILGKHSKQSFHDSHSSAHIKLELIHSNLCGLLGSYTNRSENF